MIYFKKKILEKLREKNIYTDNFNKIFTLNFILRSVPIYIFKIFKNFLNFHYLKAYFFVCSQKKKDGFLYMVISI